MGMSGELYHRILWALQTLDKYHTTIAVDYPEDILSLMGDFCAWYETDGVIKMGRNKTDILREQLFNDLQLTAKCINEFVDCNIPVEEQMRIRNLVVEMSELFMYWHKKGHCGEAKK